MNTEIRKIIEKFESDQQELERLVNERTTIMKNERRLSTGNFRREMSIIENFIKRKSEEIMNDRRTVENYTHASDLMRELTLAPGSKEERAEKEEELNSVMETLPTELRQELINRENNGQVVENTTNDNEQIEENTPQVSDEERLRTLQEALEIAKSAYQASADNFQTIFSNERNEIAEKSSLTKEELAELNSRYSSAKKAENERLQRSRELIAEIESGINNLNEVIEQKRRKQEERVEGNTEYQSMPIEKALGTISEKSLTPAPRKSLVPIIPIDPNKIKGKDENATIPTNKSLVPAPEPKKSSASKKYKASNIKVSKDFKEELKSRDDLYIIDKMAGEYIKKNIAESIDEIIKNYTSTDTNTSPKSK